MMDYFIKYLLLTVGENIIATTKNNYCSIQSFKCPILDFSLLPLVKLSLLILFASFYVSVLCFFLIALSPTLLLFLAIKGDSENITITFR